MHINVDTLIIGAGYSGLIIQKKLQSIGHQNNLIVERGYSNGYTDSDYVIVTKSEFPFTGDIIDINIERHSSGSNLFDNEYAKKVYNRKINATFFSKDNERVKGMRINNEVLLKDSKCYGNIDVQSIDYQNKTVSGRVLHLNEKVTIKYNRLINTVPIHRFMKLVDMDFLKLFNLFISYFPIGIQKVTALDFREEMTIEYNSDPAVPYYRKQYYESNIFYEYCLNKPINIRFSAVVAPGKFVQPNQEIMNKFYDFFKKQGIYFAGRFAAWDADFLLDQIWEPGDSISNKYLREMYEQS